jgi:hypothetical protein
MKGRGQNGVACRECVSRLALAIRISRLLRVIISLSDAKYKGTTALIAQKGRFVALSPGFGLNKFYICQVV